MNLNHFYHYYKSKSGGVSNLLKASEDFDSSRDWNKLPSTDAPTVSGGITDPNGGSDAQRINFTDNRQARVQQRVGLSASTQYTFSVYARVNTGTQQFRLRNVTLGEAEAKTATTSWTRFSYTFTTTTGGNYDLSIQNTSNDARTIEFWGAMLNVGASANDYVKVDPSISGSTPTPAYSGFGDTYGDVTAYYSLRKFTEAETLNAIRVRRSSDDTEQDIGFDANGDLDTTALLAFVGTGGTDNGFVTTFYDQSGNGNDATNSTESEQPLVVSAGTLVEENSKAAVDFDGVDDNLQNASLITNTTHTIVAAFVDVDTRTFKYFYDGGASVAQMMLGTAGNEDEYRYSAGGTGNFSTLSGSFADPIDILSFAVHGTTSQIAINGSLNLSGESKANPTAGKFNIGESAANSLNAAAKFWEVIVFASDQSTNRTGIETNINDHFDIYT